MTAGIRANVDGSAAIQVGGVDAITLTSAGAASFVTSPMTIQGGSAAAPSLTFSGDTNTGIFSPAADTIAFSEGGVESMRIDASGRLGLGGVTSPTATLDVGGTSGSLARFGTNSGNGSLNFYPVTINDGNSAGGGTNQTFLRLGRNSNGAAAIDAFEAGVGGSAIAFGTFGTERARITSDGKFLVGTTTAPNFAGVGIQGGLGFSVSNTYYYTIQSNTNDFYIGNPTLTRYAALLGITTFTAWSFSSDRRIKNNIRNLDHGLEAVLQMQPRRYVFNEGGDESIGFIAQELKEVVPEAVTGEEVPFSDEDTPQERAKKTMGVSKDLLIPVLVKAIQELKAELDATKAEVALLKGAA